MGNNYKFEQWLESKDGLLSKNLWNVLDLSMLKIEDKEIGFQDRMIECLEKLLSSGMKPITTYNHCPKWVDTFYEKGEGTTIYTDIMVHVFGNGAYSTKYFWVGSRFPTDREIKAIDKKYS